MVISGAHGMEFPPLKDLLENKRIATNLQVAVGTILVVDYLETFSSEVAHIWNSPWSAIKVLFLLARYSIFIDVALIIRYYATETLNLSPITCRAFLITGAVSVVVTIAFSEAILFVRVYALSGRSRRMLVFLSIQYILTHTAEIVLMTRLTTGAGFPIIPGVTERIGCTPDTPPHTDTFLRLIFGMFLLNGAVLVTLMTWLGYKRFDRFRLSQVAVVFFRDGFNYFFIITAIGIINMVVSFEATATNFVLGEAQGIFHSIMACRLVLHLREVGSETGFASDREVRRPVHVNEADRWTTLDLQFAEPQKFSLRELRNGTKLP
ncbi:hypothetical protein FA15DRAFT_675403 [Coprinopsis marcescibilis]|uniref:DUF6533 domain-containing protein n=1 Tax=Coprinopsis marcescibilis TaxID=230819 RepID=A0A5C3KDX0_COPMA|nr:hypothetical protein FA15DRAFT_675403 [Coprinopsis marcescibilis]